MRAFSRTVSAAAGVFCLLTGSAAAQAQPKATLAAEPLTVSPDSVVVCAGDDATFTAKRGDKSVDVTWKLDPLKESGRLSTTEEKNPTISIGGQLAPTVTVVKYTAPPGQSDTTEQLAVAPAGIVEIIATDKDAKTATARVELPGRCESRYGGELVRATLGFEQVGAAGTDNTQKYSFGFFISRPLPVGSRKKTGHPAPSDSDFYFGPRFHWWGDVRIGSYPQQVNSDVATFTKDFAKNVGSVAVNKLAQTAEFLTGPEVRIAQFPEARDAITEASRQRFALMAFAGIGSIGPFPPGDDPTVFAVPVDTQSPQYAAFHAAQPTVASKYVAFVPENRHQFSRQWLVGLRLYTFYADRSGTSKPLSKAPASVEVGFGKNELVAPRENGSLPMVWRASAYYPFALGDRTKPDTLIIYFYGDANMRLHAGPTPDVPLYLAPAVDDKNVAIPLTDKDVSVVSVRPNQRDTYRIGVSIDLIRVWNKLSAPPAGQ